MKSAIELPIERLRGLRPETWVSVGNGYAREDIKALVLSQGAGLVGDAITNIQGICTILVPQAAKRLLGPLARQEVLRVLLAEKKISEQMPELKRLRRQTTFFRRLDQAIQSGRTIAAHVEEEQVFSDRLEHLLGANPVRHEVRGLARAYEIWLQASELWDLPRLIRDAIEALEAGWPEGRAKPREILHCAVQAPESLERELIDALSRYVEFRVVTPPVAENSKLSWTWQRWHTLDDAVEALAERLARGGSCEDDVVLIPDSMNIRRGLRRALEQNGIALADPRDPTRLYWDEGLKWAMLPLEVVARGFERPAVVSFLRTHWSRPEFPEWAKEINQRGIKMGLESYRGGLLSLAYSRLAELQEALGGRKTCAEVSEAHLSILRSAVGLDQKLAWLVPFFEQAWKDFVRDSNWVNHGEKRAPLLYWLERLEARVNEAQAPVERLKPDTGLRTYRLHQAPVESAKRVWILGMPPQWLSGEGVGDYWFSERERETLGSEFGVRSAIQVREERLTTLRAWLGTAAEVVVLDAQYDVGGKERESVEACLRELVTHVGGEIPEQAVEMGAHPRWAGSFGAIRPIAPRQIQLPPMKFGGEMPVISATALDSYSRCGFQALGWHRWKLEDLKEPDTELWPDARGTLLHEAVRIFATSRADDGSFSLLPSEAVDLAWKKRSPRGLIRGDRIETYVKSRLIKVLEAFAEKEREYLKRAGTKIAALDSIDFKLEFDGFAIKGIPDRLDEHPEGFFVIDYKTSSAVPNGAEMLELGYRLQLPFYALAVWKKTGKPVLGFQFIELNKKAGRSSGVFFKPYNGKEPGRITNARSNSKSLFTATPEETWTSFEERIIAHGKGFISGRFDAQPKKKDKECRSCSMSDLCALRRLQDEEAANG